MLYFPVHTIFRRRKKIFPRYGPRTMWTCRRNFSHFRSRGFPITSKLCGHTFEEIPTRLLGAGSWCYWKNRDNDKASSGISDVLNRPLCSRSARWLDHNDGLEFGEAAAAIKPEVTERRDAACATAAVSQFGRLIYFAIWWRGHEADLDKPLYPGPSIPDNVRPCNFITTNLGPKISAYTCDRTPSPQSIGRLVTPSIRTRI